MAVYYKKFTEEQDGRRKILTSQYEEVRAEYRNLKSMRKVARLFGVDKRTIQFIVYPERLEHLKKIHRERKHWMTYYNREQLTNAVRNLRAKKKALGLTSRTKTEDYK